MGAVTHGVATASTSNASSYVSGAFTPAAGDLLVAFVVASGTVASGALSGSAGLTFTKAASAVKAAGADTIYCFVANESAAASSQTVTFTCTGDAATGAVIQVARVSGIAKRGAAAVRQTAKQDNQAGGGTPAPAFSQAALTGNVTLGVVGNAANPATLTPPTNWTERNDTGFATPTTGAEYVSRDSGFTGTTITWGGTSASAFGSLIVEIDADNSGSLSQTLGAVTSSASGTVSQSGALSSGLGSATSSGTGAVDVAAALSGNTGTATASASGTVAASESSGAADITLGSATGTGAGTASVSGAGSVSLGNASASSAGAVENDGSASVGLSPATSSAAGGVAVSGSGSGTLSGVQGSSAGVVPVSGTAGQTLESAGISATGGSPPATGSLDATTSPVTVSASGAVEIQGSASVTGSATVQSGGAVAVSGTTGETLDPASVTAGAGVEISGGLSASLGSTQGSASGSASDPGSTGTLSVQLGTAVLGSKAYCETPDMAGPKRSSYGPADQRSSQTGPARPRRARASARRRAARGPSNPRPIG